MDGEMACRLEDGSALRTRGETPQHQRRPQRHRREELIVNPAVRPSAQRAVTTATPVGKAPSARRNSRSSVTAVSAAGGDPGDLSTQRYEGGCLTLH